MKILITGINGFVGKNIYNYLKTQYDLIGVSQTPKKNQISWEMFFANSHDAEVWVHLAGIAHDVKGSISKQEYFRINADLAIKTYNHFLNSKKAKKFIFFSSIKSIASYSNTSLTEDDKHKINNYYGLSKRYAEEKMLENIVSNKKLVIIRPCMIYGNGNKGNLNLLYKFINKGFPYPFGKFDNQRSFLFINNLLFVLSEIISTKDFPSGIFNVANDENLSSNDLVHLISAACNRPLKIYFISPLFIKFLFKIGDFLYFPYINIKNFNKLTKSFKVSNTKIKKQLQIESMPYKTGKSMLSTLKEFDV